MKKITTAIAAFCLILSPICYAETTSDIMKGARLGNAEAQFKAASLYASGKIGKKDKESQNIMFDWLEKSASQNYAKAQEILYKKYFELEKFEKAAKWAQEAVKRKDRSAMSVMAYLNYFGCKTVPINRKKAFDLSEQSMNQPLSQVIQGMFYLRGCDKFEIDIALAKDCAESAIRKKNPYGHILMAEIYLSYNDEDYKNIEIAEQNLQEAIKKNCSAAMVKLGDLYLNYYSTADKTVKATNLYVKASKYLNPASFRQLAIHVLEKNTTNVLAKYQSMCALQDAADYGDPQAQVLLWECHTTSRYGFEKDNGKAKQYMAKAIESGDPEALYAFAMILQRIDNSNDKNEIEMFKYSLDDSYTYDYLMKKAVDNLHPVSNYVYGLSLNDSDKDGMMYISNAANMGVPEAQFTMASSMLQTDPVQAYSWALKSAENKEVNGLALAGALSIDGIGCEQDKEGGVKLLEEAAIYGNVSAIKRLVAEYYLGENIEPDIEKAYIYAKIFGDDSLNHIVESCKEELSQDKLQSLEIKYAEMTALSLIKSAENAYNIQKRYFTKYLK